MLFRSLPFALALATAPALAADVLVVAADGSGDYAYPFAAVSAAADGDTILFQPGSYGGLILSAKSLVLVAATPGTVTVDGISVEDLASSHRVVISGIQASALGGGFSALDVRDSQGAVRVENGTFTGSSGSYGGLPGSVGFPGVYLENASDVAFAGCTLVGGAGESGVVGTSTEWEPCPPAASNWYQGGPGLHLVNSSASLHQCALVGGAGGDGIFCGYSGPGGPALKASSSSAFLAGCDVVGGTGGFVEACECGGDGGTTYVLDGTLVDALDTTFTIGGPAPGSLAGGAGPAPTLTGGAVLATLAGAARDLVAPGALTAGALLAIDVNGELGDAVFLAASGKPGSFQLSGVTGLLLLTPPFFVSGAPLGTIGAGGQVSASFPTPVLPVGVEHGTIFLQALSVDAGGAFVLTGSRAVTLITSAILP